MLWWLVLALAGLIAVAAILVALRAKADYQRLRTALQRKSALYADFYPLLLLAEEKGLEEITVSLEHIELRLLSGPRDPILYKYEAHSFDPPDEDARYAIAQALAVDCPDLNRGDRYQFRTLRRETPGGQRYRCYRYTVLPAWRQVLRQREYDRLRRSDPDQLDR